MATLTTSLWIINIAFVEAFDCGDCGKCPSLIHHHQTARANHTNTKAQWGPLAAPRFTTRWIHRMTCQPSQEHIPNPWDRLCLALIAGLAALPGFRAAKLHLTRSKPSLMVEIEPSPPSRLWPARGNQRFSRDKSKGKNPNRTA
jgi:hypothetical protein